MPLVKPVVRIENVVACAALKHGIDLRARDKGVRTLDRGEWCFLYSSQVSSSARRS